MVRSIYEVIMDAEKNPFMQLPKIVRFQLMIVMSYMWSAVFTIWIGSMYTLWPSIVGHTALLVGVFFTADIFRRANDKKLVPLKIKL